MVLGVTLQTCEFNLFKPKQSSTPSLCLSLEASLGAKNTSTPQLALQTTHRLFTFTHKPNHHPTEVLDWARHGLPGYGMPPERNPITPVPCIDVYCKIIGPASSLPPETSPLGGIVVSPYYNPC